MKLGVRGESTLRNGAPSLHQGFIKDHQIGVVIPILQPLLLSKINELIDATAEKWRDICPGCTQFVILQWLFSARYMN
jgi:hypothetical protein